MLLSSIIENFKNVRVLCIGDIMLDHFIYGDVNRISPEAPVPIFEYNSKQSMLGGCGNVVNNLRAIGCPVSAFCMVGADPAGSHVRSLVENVAPKSMIMEIPGYTTIEKTRIVAEHNHLLRIDHEDAKFDESPLNKALVEKLPPLVENADVVLLSDYAKGMLNHWRCQRIIDICRKLSRMVIVDPKGNDYSKYAGATLIKPNLKEFTAASGVGCSPKDANFEDSLRLGAKNIFAQGVDHLIVTLSQHGMAYISADNPDDVLRLAAAAREVFDVSGAGDTSLAVLGASCATGAGIGDAIKLANIASGIAVGKIGTSIVSADELRDAVAAQSPAATNTWKQKVKIISKKQAVEIARAAREKNQKIVFTNGCFDLLHLGHVKSLMAAKACGDILMVGLNTDYSIKRLKGSSRPIQDEKCRSLLLASMSFVDYIIMFDDDTAEDLAQSIKPDIIAKEGYAIQDWPEARLVEAYGGRAITLPRAEGFSTSALINHIQSLGKPS